MVEVHDDVLLPVADNDEEAAFLFLRGDVPLDLVHGKVQEVEGVLARHYG